MRHPKIQLRIRRHLELLAKLCEMHQSRSGKILFLNFRTCVITTKKI